MQEVVLCEEKHSESKERDLQIKVLLLPQTQKANGIATGPLVFVPNDLFTSFVVQ